MSNDARPVMLITGGTGSIGGEIARRALAGGWAVVVQGRNGESVEAALAALRSRHPESAVAGVVADIKTAGGVERLVAEAAGSFNRLDAVVDCLVTGPENARINGPFGETDPDAYLPFAQWSIVYLEQLAFQVLPWLKKSGGTLISFVSDAALFPAPRQTLIGAARAAAVAFVKNLAAEVARDGVRAHCISPGFVDESRIAEKLAASGSDRLEKARRRAGLGLPTPADIAPLVVFLCGEGARRMTGQVISVNGGLNV